MRLSPVVSNSPYPQSHTPEKQYYPPQPVRHPDEAPPIPPRAPIIVQHANSFNDSTFENVPLRHSMEPQQNGSNQRRRPQSGKRTF